MRPMDDVGILCVPGVAESIRTLRDFTVRKLGKEHPRLDEIVLCVSELGTNGLEHTCSGRPGGRLTLLIGERARATRIELIDEGGSASVHHVREQPEAEDGRGLLLVRELSSRWGVEGTTTWCEFDLPM
jgi:anti-sigma regulatory factor (Ser/Thr protein kinase)